MTNTRSSNTKSTKRSSSSNDRRHRVRCSRALTPMSLRFPSPLSLVSTRPLPSTSVEYRNPSTTASVHRLYTFKRSNNMKKGKEVDFAITSPFFSFVPPPRLGFSSSKGCLLESDRRLKLVPQHRRTANTIINNNIYRMVWYHRRTCINERLWDCFRGTLCKKKRENQILEHRPPCWGRG